MKHLDFFLSASNMDINENFKGSLLLQLTIMVGVQSERQGNFKFFWISESKSFELQIEDKSQSVFQTSCDLSKLLEIRRKHDSVDGYTNVNARKIIHRQNRHHL